MSLPIAIVASGNGTNAQAMIDLMHKGVLDVDIRLIFCNRPNARVIERAKAAGIPWQMEDHKLYPTREAFDAVMIDALKKSGAELIVLAGYMRLLTKSFLDAFKNRVVNIHPSLLPAFGGGVHAGPDALAYGVKLSGCTVHFVEMEVDSVTRIHALEHRIYPQAVQWIAEGRVSVEGRKVHVAKADKPLAQRPAECLVWPPLEEGF